MVGILDDKCHLFGTALYLGTFNGGESSTLDEMNNQVSQGHAEWWRHLKEPCNLLLILLFRLLHVMTWNAKNERKNHS